MPNLVPDSLSKPAEILLPAGNHGRPASLDIHVISSFQQQTVGEAAFTLGHALQVGGVQRKLASQLSAYRSAGVDFIPIVTDVLGGLAEDTISIIRTFGEAIGWRVTPKAPPPAPNSSFIVAISLWWGNASLWLHRQPILPPLWMV